MLSTQASDLLKHPIAFALRVIRAFRANQGYLLAGAVAYNTLLSILPLLILMLIGLTRFVDEAALLTTLGRYLELVVPGQSGRSCRNSHCFSRTAKSSVGSCLLPLSSSVRSRLRFWKTRCQSSLFIAAVRRRRLLVSVLLPFFYILFLGVGLLIVTFVSGALETMGEESIAFLGRAHSLLGISRFLLYLIGVAGEILVLTSIYMVMPVGRLSWRHALIGGVVAGLLWEITRHVLVWYFFRLSQVKVVYGSLTTAIVVLLSLEIAALVLLLGAQVIAEFERGASGDVRSAPEPLRTD